ncbi:MAG: hypothetical protein HOP11_15185 [Saprospiraceae bacterium]|nr:hypothetical protein [Saprospiraceae bacterium]
MTNVKTFFSKHTLICLLIILLSSCEKDVIMVPDWCTEGTLTALINDEGIDDMVKNIIYEKPQGYRIPVDGVKKIIVIPYFTPGEFEYNTAVTSTLIEHNFFTVGTGSIRDYFLENSWGQFDITKGQISAPASLPQFLSTYGSEVPSKDPSRNISLAYDICSNSTINWALFDTNGDKIITAEEVQICLMEPTGGSGATRYYSFQVNNPSTGEVFTVQNYFVFFGCKSNTDPNKLTDPISFNFSTIWHELCHGMFGLPDRYAAYCSDGNTGRYDIMSNNCNWMHMNIYDKMKLGWIHPKILATTISRFGTSPQCIQIPAVESGKSAFILYDPKFPDEYWMVENRNKASSKYNFEKGLDDEGLIIWWIDLTETAPEKIVHLVSSKDWGKNPKSYTYKVGDPGSLMFKGKEGLEFGTVTLANSSGGLSLVIRKLSPSSKIMFGEF